MLNLRLFRYRGQSGKLIALFLPLSLWASAVSNDHALPSRMIEFSAATFEVSAGADIKIEVEQLNPQFALDTEPEAAVLNTASQVSPAELFDISSADSRNRLTKCIFLVLLIGGLIRYFTSAAFRRLFDDIVWFFVIS